MTLVRRTAAVVALAVVAFAALVPSTVLAVSPSFGTPTVSAELNEPITFSSQIEGDDIAAVEVLIGLVGDPTNIVLAAQPGAGGTWEVTQSLNIGASSGCECLFQGNSAPNTHFEFQFRVRATDGTVAVGPIGQGVVEDKRFEWRTLESGLVRVHWYAGDDAFARGAADYANQAIDRASELLGTTLPAPVDLFVYDTQQDLLDAVSPNRESIAGEAHGDIQTMFVWLPHEQDIDGFSGEVVRHELTHLVFDAATHNEYHDPPTWLNEGIAVYLSVGYDGYYRSLVEGAKATDTLIPLNGLTGIFPAPEQQFYLAYGEGVAAVDYFVSTYGEQTLWDLVRSYQQGMTDDDAFTAATGSDAAAFNAAWFESLGEAVPAPLGPQPGAPGPVPPDWAPGGATPGPTLAPGETPPTPRPTATPRPGTGPGVVDGVMRVLTLTLWVVAIGLILAVIGVVLYVRRSNRQPPRGW